jgi:PST family polysaccharide transporter
MESTDVAVIKGKIVSGVFALTSRTLILQAIALVAKTLLTVILTPAVFGTYYIATAFIDFFNYFSDIGLAAALIQKKEEPTLLDLRTVFTVQQSLIGILVLLGFIFSEKIGLFYHLDAGGVFLIRALLISFFLSSLKTIPSIILERHLAFNKMILPQVLENLVFNIKRLFKIFG